MADFGDEVASDVVEGLKDTLDAVDGEARAAAKDLVASYVRNKRVEHRAAKEGMASGDGRNGAAASGDGAAGNEAEEEKATNGLGLGLDAEEDPFKGISPVEITLPTSCIETIGWEEDETSLVACLPQGFEFCGKDYSGYLLNLGSAEAEPGNWSKCTLDNTYVACLTSPAGTREYVPTASLTARGRAFEAVAVFSLAMNIEHGEILQDASRAAENVTQAFDASGQETPEELKRQIAELTSTAENLQSTIDEMKNEIATIAADHPVSLPKAMRAASGAVEHAADAVAEKAQSMLDGLRSVSERIARAVTRDLPALAASAGANVLDAVAKPFSRASQGLAGKAESLRGGKRGFQSSKADQMFAQAKAEAAGAGREVQTTRAGGAPSQTRARGIG